MTAEEWQLTIDCQDPARLVAFWSDALGYQPKPAPPGFATWNDWYRSVGVSEDELDSSGDGCDRLVHPEGIGPAIWFQVVPETKATKNRLHLDVFVGGGRAVPLAERRERVQQRVSELEDLGASVVSVSDHPAIDHFFVVMADPEGNEFCVA